MVRFASVSPNQKTVIALLKAGAEINHQFLSDQGKIGVHQASFPRRPKQQDDPTQFLVDQQQFAASVQWLFTLDSNML